MSKNLNEIKAKALKLAKERRANRKEAREIAKYENDKYVDLLVAREERAENVEKLENVVEALNDIATVKVPVIGKVSVNCYAPTNIFGAELGLLLGIAGTLKNLFIDAHIEEAYTIIETNKAKVEDLGIALGDTAFFNKNTGEKRDAIEGSFEDAYDLIEDFAKDLDITPDMSKFTEARYNKWFATKATTADTKHKEHLRMLEVNKTQEFTISEVDEDEVLPEDPQEPTKQEGEE